MARYVALLRGINVGGKAKVAMPALRAAIESLGYDDVATYIQSGNVAFSTSKKVTAAPIEKVIERDCGVTCAVMIRTHREMVAVVEHNPFPKADTSKLHVGFMASAPGKAALAGLDTASFAPEEVALRGREVYLHLPTGMGRAKLPVAVGRKLKEPTTVRNWNTVNKLVEMSSG